MDGRGDEWHSARVDQNGRIGTEDGASQRSSLRAMQIRSRLTDDRDVDEG